jgi:hypothetical protein
MTSAKRCALLASSQRRSACWSTAQAPYNVHFPEREMHLNRSESRMLTHRTNVIHHCALIRNLLFWGPGVDAHNHQWSGNRESNAAECSKGSTDAAVSLQCWPADGAFRVV